MEPDTNLYSPNENNEIIRENSQKILSVLAAHQIALWEYDIPTGKCSFTDDYFRTLGLKEAGVVFKDINDFYHFAYPEDINAYQTAFAKMLASESKASQIQVRCVGEHGEVIWLEDHFLSYKGNEEGDPDKLLAYTVNVTSQCEKEQLTLINGPLETLQEMEIADPKIQKNLSVITQNTNRLLTLTGQLLDFQKIGAHKFEMTMECVDITSLLRETVARFEPTISKKNKELTLHIPEESIEAVVDKEAITKILSNLLNNALKYARHSICVELQREMEAFLVRVTSDGDKIPAEISQQIFEPFYQAAKKDSASFGVGIGLPLARSLASLHRGKLYLDSEHEDNSFVISVPLVENTLRSLPKLEEITVETDTLGEGVPVEAEMKSYVLLLVEDNETMLEFMSERLLEVFTVETAKNGQEALEVLRSRRIDLVISDIMMPVMNGWELCKEIKSDMDLSHIPVIFLTAKNDIDSKINGLKIGAEAYVEKPFSFNYLKTQIVSLLYNRQKEREAFSKRPFFPTNKMQMNKVDEEFMNKVIRTIEENIIDTNLNVEHLAEILGMSRSSLLRKIKMLSNLSPVDFIRLIRLRKAAELIHEGKYLIGDICFMVGINSPSYFSKLFLKQFGMTPKDFEKQSQADKEKIDMPS